MGNPPPLSVDPEQLAAAGNELKYSAGQLPDPPGPFGVVGSDQLTQAIDLQIPAIEDPIATQLPAVKVQATKTAQNVISAAEAYLTTDQQLGGQISQEMQNLPAAEGLSGGAGSAGGAAASAAGGGGGDPGGDGGEVCGEVSGKVHGGGAADYRPRASRRRLASSTNSPSGDAPR